MVIFFIKLNNFYKIQLEYAVKLTEDLNYGEHRRSASEKIIILSLESIGILVRKAMEMLAAREHALRNI